MALHLASNVAAAAAAAATATAVYASASQHPLLLLTALAVLAVWIPWAVNRWTYRHIPGPFSLPLIGDLPWILKYGLYDYAWRCQQKYGKVFKIYTGNSMTLMVADPEVSKRLTYKMINRSMPPQLKLDSQTDTINRTGLAAASGETWRTLRLAWQPAFQSGSLEGYTQLMDECAAKLAEYLHEKGRSGEVVEMWRALGQMTLAVVGSTAYGVDFHTLPGQATPDEKADGLALQAACATLFATLGIKNGSLWQVANVLLPGANSLISWLAAAFPDRKLQEAKKARKIIREVSLGLINRWRRGHPVLINAAAAGAPATTPAAPDAGAAAAADPSPAAGKEDPLVESIDAIVPGSKQAEQAEGSDAAVDAKVLLRRPEGKGVNPGSFLGLMLATKDSSNGKILDDDVIVAQSNTFILAGYETTANTLSFCIHSIASHPEVQQRLLQEVDEYGRDRSVAYEDLAQFPYTEAMVREALRLYPPATMLNRRVKAGGFQVAPGIVVPEGGSVFPFLYGYQRSPEYWPAAEEFRPERWLPEGKHLAATTPDAWTPFGSGARMCIGWRFALQEAKIALVRLYQHQTYELLPGQTPLELQQNLTLSPKYGVYVRVVPRT